MTEALASTVASQAVQGRGSAFGVRQNEPRPVPSRTRPDPYPYPAQQHNGRYGATRERIENKLPRHWRAPLVQNPTPAEECAAWMADAGMLLEAARRAS